MKYFVVLLALVLCVGCANNRNPTAPTDITPVITLFAADNTRLSFVGGQTTMLRWEVADVSAKVRIDPYPGNVPTVGSAPVVPIATGTLSFVLTATNQYGSTQRFVTVTVQ
jgi:hypothetical protein